MKTSRPLAITVPAAGVLFAESVHTGDFHMAPRTDPFHKLLYVLRGRIVCHEADRAPESASAGVLFAESVHTGDFHMAPRTDPFHKLLYVLRGRIVCHEADRAPESASAG